MATKKIRTATGWADSGQHGFIRTASGWAEFGAAGGPTYEVIEWPTPPTLTDGNDAGQNYNLGLKWHLSGSGGQCVGVEWNPTPTSTATPAGGSFHAQLWNADTESLLAGKSFVATPGGVQQRIFFDTPIDVVVGANYVSTIYTIDYVFLSNTTWDEVSPSGRIHADTGRLRADNSGVPAFPPDSFNAIYFISPIMVFTP